MCWKCTSNLTQEQMAQQLESILYSPIKSFNDFNTSSVQSILYCNIGLFGEACRETSFEVMDKFIDYLQTKKPMYLPETGLEAMYHPELIKKIYWNAKNYDTDYSKLDDLDYQHNVLGYLLAKLNEYDQELEKSFVYRFTKYMSKPYLVSEQNTLFYDRVNYCIGIILGVGLGLVANKIIYNQL